MAYEFKRLSDVDFVENATDAANILIEDQGVIKKVPKTTIGGNNNSIVVTIPLQDSGAPSATNLSDVIPGATCNKTYSEVLQMLASGDIEYCVAKGIDPSNHALKFQSIIGAYAYDDSGNMVSPLSANVLGVHFEFYDLNIFYRKEGLFNTSGVSNPGPPQ